MYGAGERSAADEDGSRLSRGRDKRGALPRDEPELFHHAVDEKGLARARVSAQHENLIVEVQKPFANRLFRVRLIGREGDSVAACALVHKNIITHCGLNSKHLFYLF